MRRIYIEPDLLSAGEFEFDRESAHYISRVLRLGSGDEIELFDGQGRTAVALLIEVNKKTVRCCAETIVDDPPAHCPTLISALPLIKGERLDLAIRMLTELGVDEIVLMLSQRGVVRNDGHAQERLQRLTRVMQAAARQSGRNRLPRLSGPWGLEQLVAFEADLRLFGDVDRHATVALGTFKPQRVLIYTGPEGGFSDDEAAALRNAGFVSVGLGPHILRAETAAVAGLAWLHGAMAAQ